MKRVCCSLLIIYINEFKIDGHLCQNFKEDQRKLKFRLGLQIVFKVFAVQTAFPWNS